MLPTETTCMRRGTPLANLADVAGEVSISARAKPKSGFDKSKLENGVLELLRELGLIEDEED